LQCAPTNASEQPFPAAKHAVIIPVGILACSSPKVISSLGSKEAQRFAVLPQEYLEMFFYRHRTRQMVVWVQSPVFLQPFWKTGLFWGNVNPKLSLKQSINSLAHTKSLMVKIRHISKPVETGKL